MFKLTRNLFKEITLFVKDNNAIHIDSILFRYKHYKEAVNLNNYQVRKLTGVPYNIPSAFASLMNDGNKVIVVNDGYNSLPSEYKKAIYLHELGHIELGHLENKLDTKLSEFQQELEADDFSMKHGGDIIGTYNYFMINYPLLVVMGGIFDRVKYYVSLGYDVDLKTYRKLKVMRKIVELGAEK